MEFDTSDEEGRTAEIERKQRLKKRHCARKDETVVMKNFMSVVGEPQPTFDLPTESVFSTVRTGQQERRHDCRRTRG